jgi:sugar diacid utilization regulator
VTDSVRSGRTVAAGPGTYAAAALAGTEHVATLVLHGVDRDLDLAEQRTLERGAIVTALVLLLARTVAETEDRLGAALLGDLLDGDPSDLGLRERARRQHVVLEPPLSVAVVAPAGVDRYAAVRALARVAAAEHGLAGEYRDRLVLLVPGPEPVQAGERARAALVQAGGDATVGVAETRDDLATAYAEARRCLDTLVTLGRTGQVSDPAGLGLARLLLGENGPAELAGFLDATLGPVLAYDRRRGTRLEETLEAWFATGCRAGETAARLHVHPNTVAQRLDRITGLLGPEWRDPSRSLDLQVALRIHRLRAAP